MDGTLPIMDVMGRAGRGKKIYESAQSENAQSAQDKWPVKEKARGMTMEK